MGSLLLQVMQKFLVVLIVGIAISGCTPAWMKVNCGWLDQVAPIKPSRADKLTRGTQEQIVALNESWEANCRR